MEEAEELYAGEPLERGTGVYSNPWATSLLRFEDARRFMRKCWCRTILSWGDSHLYTFVAENNLAFFYGERGMQRKGSGVVEEKQVCWKRRYGGIQDQL
jgi:hypothetical protein